MSEGKVRKYGARRMDLHFWGDLCEANKNMTGGFECEPVYLASDYDQLAAEVAALRAALANSFCDLREEVLRLTSQLAQAQADAERYRYWRQHQYNGLLDVDEFCDANSPQAIHFDRITDAAIDSALSNQRGEKA